MEKQEVVAVIVLDESEEEELVQLEVHESERATTEGSVDLDGLATQQVEMNSSRDEDEDDEAFAPWPFKQRNKPPATTSRSASAAKPKADDFKALDEEELLADLFGAADDNRSQKLRKKRADEAEAPARKLRKTRSRERGVVHPKLNPLKITGGNAKAKPPSPVALDERGVEEEEKEEENALEDSVEDVEGEECPLCEQRFSADLLQAHVEAELEQRNPSAAGGQQAPRPQPPSRSGAGPGVEGVVLDDEEEEEIECSGDGGGPEGDKAECPFCQRHFRRGVELEEHVHHEMTLRENGGSGGASGEQARRGGAGECEGRRTVTRTRLPLVRQSSRKLPSSFGANDAPADGTLNSFFAKRAPASASSSSSSSSSGSVALVPDSQPARSQKRPATEGGEEGAEDEDNYDDVTFNFKPLWATQELPYDYQNQFNKQKKKRGRGAKKPAYEEEEEEQPVEVDLVEEIEEAATPPKRGGRGGGRGRGTGRGRSKASRTSSFSSASSTIKKKSWRGARRGGWGRGRAKRGG
ncbi:uncharacterized protein ACA1_287640 [Acanthamoeba castellanii str. Neff]|uniref:Uncharacterized protein n=1 Tax=Acanthamoeba castellanii (strain ATCC 30010 / Neff) TaxID=1257118 RepID=L8HIP2_ACACF|nr:uncharacterized protein ACA1_287640 [Acanthamoeba castellanii str. Neff]ELR25065.1 hypothetical protein ACA1_287640 [Acanthamoeba castellanii str. Neff]